MIGVWAGGEGAVCAVDEGVRGVLSGAGVVLLCDVQPLPHHGGGEEAA